MHSVNSIICIIQIFVVIFCIHKIIADNGYIGEDDLIRTSNDLDDPEVSKFKDRVLSRQESINSRLKNFACLKTKWRHGVETHEIAFKACCLLIYYEIKFGSKSLFDAYP